MEKFGKSQSVKRVDDVLFLTGHGGSGDDFTSEGSLRGHVLRSNVAHRVISMLNVADTLARAKNAAGLIELEIDDLDALGAVAAGGPVLHDVAPDNVAFDWDLGDAYAVEAALSTDAHVITVRNRAIVNSLQPRDRFGEPEGNRLHDRVNGQSVWGAGMIFQ